MENIRKPSMSKSLKEVLNSFFGSNTFGLVDLKTQRAKRSNDQNERSNKLSIKGYILLESLLALLLLSVVTSFMLRVITDSQRVIVEDNHKIEVLNTGAMALDAGISQLSANGVNVRIVQSDKRIALFDNEKEVLHLEIQTIQK